MMDDDFRFVNRVTLTLRESVVTVMALNQFLKTQFADDERYAREIKTIIAKLEDSETEVLKEE